MVEMITSLTPRVTVQRSTLPVLLRTSGSSCNSMESSPPSWILSFVFCILDFSRAQIIDLTTIILESKKVLRVFRK